jgi:two-component system chemotaxis sensor kinase CheA
MAQDPYKYFRVEARDLLDQFAKGILDLEKNGISAALLQRLLRLAHTLKGAARVVKQMEIADLSHAIEDVLSPLRDSTGAVARAQIDIILAHLDQIGGRVSELFPADTAERPLEGPAIRDDGSRSSGSRTVRADVAEMDIVLDGIAETRTLLNGLRGAAREVEQVRHLADLLSAQLAPQRAANHGRPSGRNLQQLFAIAEELRRKFSGVDRSLVSTIDQMDRELRQLHDGAEQLRLVSVDSLFTVLERTARDAAQALSKQVTFEATGGGIRLDSHVVETVQGGLIQLIRNAVAHGIEPQSERTAAGKPAAGRVSVDVTRRGRRVVFACGDDGRGLDLEAVRRVALQRGLIDPTTKQGSAEALMRVLLHGGISTSKTVTAVSGRGVGLDVVRAAIERLGGEVVVRTAPGTGTTFELIVPASLASMEALTVAADGSGNVMAIPLDAVRNTLRVGAADISHGSSGASVLYDQTAIAFVPLSTVLDGARWSVNRNWSAIILAGAEGLAAVGVERLLGTARIVVRPLPEGLPVNPVVVGASLDSDGNPQLVLDPAGLIAAAQRGGASSLDAASPKRPLLVIDDSLTTRMLEQSILESAGYEVDVALSAEEALDVVRRKRYALILVDVEMPGMDGFGFIERIRSEPTLRDIPAILVTSRAEPEDRQRGREVGAQGYIGKGEFDQAELLTMIKSLIG